MVHRLLPFVYRGGRTWKETHLRRRRWRLFILVIHFPGKLGCYPETPPSLKWPGGSKPRSGSPQSRLCWPTTFCSFPIISFISRTTAQPRVLSMLWPKVTAPCLVRRASETKYLHDWDDTTAVRTIGLNFPSSLVSLRRRLVNGTLKILVKYIG